MSEHYWSRHFLVKGTTSKTYLPLVVFVNLLSSSRPLPSPCTSTAICMAYLKRELLGLGETQDGMKLGGLIPFLKPAELGLGLAVGLEVVTKGLAGAGTAQ